MRLKIKTPAFIEYDGKLQPVNLYDTLVLEKLNERKIQIIKSKGYKIPTNNLNPVYQAAFALQELKPNKFGAVIKVQKDVPTFSGLNSQLSNAAGALIALNKLWGFDLSKSGLRKIAKKIDPKIEKILKSKESVKKHAILIRPKYLTTNPNWTTKKILEHFPDIKNMIDIIKKNGARKCRLSGKGSVVFGFFEKNPDIKKIKKLIGKKIDFIWSGKTCNGTCKLLN